MGPEERLNQLMVTNLTEEGIAEEGVVSVLGLHTAKSPFNNYKRDN